MFFKKVIMMVAAAGFFHSVTLQAQEQEQLMSEEQGDTDLALDESANQSIATSDNVGYIHWDFLTCVCDVELCRDEAQQAGFPHYRVRHEHFRCQGHDHLACYGGHH